MVDRIAWTKPEYGGWQGRAGRLHLFTISWRIAKSDPQWTLSSQLLGFTSKRWKDDDPDKLKARAERVLAAWLEEVGGIEEPAPAAAPPEPTGRFVHVVVTVELRSRGGTASEVIEVGTEELEGMSPEERDRVIHGYAEQAAGEMAPWGWVELEGEFEEGEGLES